MRAVWSFWSKPYQAGKHSLWVTPMAHALAWGLSVQHAGKHYPDTALVTDSAGRRLLVEQLGIPFRHVSTELDCLRDVDAGFFALGKLVAYSLQERPFLHIDTDVFLWKPLPPAVTSAPVIAQNPEFHVHGVDSPVHRLEIAFRERNLSLPIEWQQARARNSAWLREENCGIVGGGNVEFLRNYARKALNLVMAPQNSRAWESLGDGYAFNWCVEQLFLAACVDFHDVKIRYLFPSTDESYDINRAVRLGYTHLLGSAKSHPSIGQRLQERMRRENPEFFRRCERVIAGS